MIRDTAGGRTGEERSLQRGNLVSSPDGSPIRVLHVIAWLNRGGIETWLMNMLRAADRGEVAMDFLCQGPGEGATAGEARELGATVAWMRLGLRPWRFIRRAADLMRDRYDVVHAHLGPGSGPALDAAARAGVPAIVKLRIPDSV